MATSGSVDFNQNRDQIIEDAFNQLGILSEGESLTNDQVVSANRTLNRMIKHWQSHGIHLWKYREGTLFLQQGIPSYDLGSTGDNATESFIATSLAADETAGSNTITVDDATGILDGDYIGIVLNGNDAQWTTVNGSPVGNVITLTANLTGDADTGQYVYAYTTKITRPLLVTSGRFRTNSTNEIPMRSISRQEYFDLPNKITQGESVQWYYNPLLDNGKIYIWPTANDATNYINFTFFPDFEDFDQALNTADFPVEWLDTIVFNLAERLATQYGITGVTYDRIVTRATQLLEESKGWDIEKSSIEFSPYGDREHGWS
jgi:hypothetical protein